MITAAIFVAIYNDIKGAEPQLPTVFNIVLWCGAIGLILLIGVLVGCSHILGHILNIEDLKWDTSSR